MIEQTISPVLFSIGTLEIRFYGLVYVLGFVAAYLGLTRTGLLKKEQAESFLTWALIGMLLGSRIFHFLFYDPTPPWTLVSLSLFGVSIPIPAFFALWLGGMSFHGAILGIGVATLWWTRKHKVRIAPIADMMAIFAAFFLALGRIANYINSEIVGTITDNSWCVQFPNAQPPYNEGCRHPVQLYAALKDVFIGSILLLLRKRGGFKDGFLFWCFVTLYGVLRFSVNFFRADPVLIGWLKWGHVLSGLMIIGGITILLKYYKQDLTGLVQKT